MAPDVDAELLEVLPSLESIVYVRAVLGFHNSSHAACHVVRYTLSWDGGSVTAQPRDLRLAADETTRRTVRVTPAQGDIHALIRAQRAAHVDVVAEWTRV